MSIIVELGDTAAVEALLRAGLVLKFDVPDGDEVLNGSPIYAGTLNSLREALIEELRSEGLAGRADRTADWYRLSRHEHRWETIAERAIRHPNWTALSSSELRSWIETVAAPLSVDDAAFNSIKEVAAELHGD